MKNPSPHGVPARTYFPSVIIRTYTPSVIASEAKQSSENADYHEVDCFVANAPRNDREGVTSRNDRIEGVCDVGVEFMGGGWEGGDFVKYGFSKPINKTKQLKTHEREVGRYIWIASSLTLLAMTPQLSSKHTQVGHTR